jgi:DNA-binding winged helix-turn-helix (wHTH) protein
MDALGSNGHCGRVRFGIFEFDVESGELRKAGKTVRLQPQPSKVLAILVARPGQLVTRQELKHQIWNGTIFVDFEQGLNFSIRQIRVALARRRR